MKFGKKILSVSGAGESFCPAYKWIDYKKLKKLVKNCQKTENVDPKAMKSSVEEKAFFKFLLTELRKVSLTYIELETAALQNLLLFIPEVEKLKATERPTDGQFSKILKECAEHHLRFVMLENYAVMNYCGFTKILKKHDKVTGFNTREKYMHKMVDSQPFATYKKIGTATSLILREFQILKGLRQLQRGVSIASIPTLQSVESSIRDNSQNLSKIRKSMGDVWNTPVDIIPNSTSTSNSISQVVESNLRKGLTVKRMSQATLEDVGIEDAKEVKAPNPGTGDTSSLDHERSNRLDDLVNLLEKHQKEMNVGSRKKRKFEITKKANLETNTDASK